MSSPGIELAWGGGAWRRSRRRAVRPFVQDVTELAVGGLDMLGVRPTTPKQVRIYQCGRKFDVGGESNSATQLELNLRANDIKRHRIARQLVAFTLTAGHELVHSIRRETFEVDSIVEAVASEGLAFVSEDLLAGVLLRPGEHNMWSRVLGHIQVRRRNEIKTRLQAEEPILTDNNYCDIYDDWFEWRSPQVPDGVVLGVSEVYERLGEGVSFAELIEWPAEQVLDLRPAA